MSVYFDSTPRAVADATNVVIQTGQASLGGTIGTRVIFDDAVITSRDVALRHLEVIRNKLMAQPWPVV